MFDKLKELLPLYGKMALNISILATMIAVSLYSVFDIRIGIIDSLMLSTTALVAGFVPTSFEPNFINMSKNRLTWGKVGIFILGILWLLNSIF